MDEWLDLYNATVEGVDAKLALHVCFGNLTSRPRGKRTYRWMFPALLDARADQLVLEFANREMSESGLWREFAVEKELGAQASSTSSPSTRRRRRTLPSASASCCSTSPLRSST